MSRIGTKHYRILDLHVVIRSDCEVFLDAFDMDYAFFAEHEGCSGRSITVSYVKNGREGPMLGVDGTFRSLAESQNPAIQAFHMVTAELMKKTDHFLIIHGAVVGRDNHALVISGPSGSGKSTLVTALIRAGFQFLSDDFCPISLDTGLVHPFPRTMWHVQHEEDGASRQKSEGFHRGSVRGGKAPVFFDPLKVRVGCKPCKARCCIAIDSGSIDDQWCSTRVHLEKRGEAVLLAASTGKAGIEVERLTEIPSIWEIRYEKRNGHAREVVDLLKTIDPYTLSKSRLAGHRPDFSREPSLVAVETHKLAHLLLRELKSEPDELRVKPGQYFMKLVELLSDVPCWILTTGRLEKMKELALSAFVKSGNAEQGEHPNIPSPYLVGKENRGTANRGEFGEFLSRRREA